MKIIIISKILLFLFLIVIKTSGQSYSGIDSLKIIPANPVTTDEISVICYSVFPHGSCFSEEFNLSIEDTIIHIENYHFIGEYTAICHSVDTVHPGNLSEGNYTLYYFLYYNTETDTTYILSDIDTIYFTVSSGNIIKSENKTDIITVYPNPANNKIKIQNNYNLVMQSIKLFDINGRLIKSFCTTGAALDISDIAKGQYVLNIQTDKGEFVEKIVIQ